MRIPSTRHADNLVNALFMLACIFSTVFASTAQEQVEDPIKSVTQETEANIEEPETSESQDIETQLDALKTTLYCPCGCDRMTFEICHCQTAEQFKKDFRKALTEGETVEEIRAVYLQTYGPQYSAVMRFVSWNILAYMMPLVILIAIGGVIYLVRRQSPYNKKTVSTPPDAQISDALQQKIESDLDQYKQNN